MGNEESHEARKDNTQETPTKTNSPYSNASQSMSNFQQQNNRPPNQGGWVMPGQNPNTSNQGKIYPTLPQPPPYNAYNPEPAKPPQPSIPQSQHQQPSASKYYPQQPTAPNFFAQPTVGSSTPIPTMTKVPIQPTPSKTHPIIPLISNEIWSQGRPQNAFRAGHDSDGTVLYICRATHCGDLLPGKVVPTHSCAYVCHEGKEIPKQSFETLIGDKYHWVPSNFGHVPPGAVEGGRTAIGEKLYIGRVAFNNSLTPGKLHPSHKCLYIPYGGKEHSFTQYEVLVHRNY